MMTLIEILKRSPVIPVLTIERAEDAVPLARALVNGGLEVLEITLRTTVALSAIEAIRKALPKAIVGAGTLTRAHDFAQAEEAGAQFGVSPGLTGELIVASGDVEFPLLPGAMTPSEVIAARNLGFSALKLFPAEQAGGINMLKAIGAPLPDVVFCPTGGVTRESAPKYLALDNVLCVGGSWVAPKDKVLAQDWAAIEALARDASGLRPATSNQPLAT